MSGVALELFIIFFLLILNGIFSMSEIAVVTAKRVRLEHQAERGSAGAKAALRLATDPSSFLSTVQVGITLVGVIASAYGGATLSEVLAARLTQVTWLAQHAEAVALTIVVAGITYVSVIVGELVPKRIALGNPERIASLVARPMLVIARIGRPVVMLLTGSTHVVLRLLGIRGVPEPGLTEEEIHAVIEQGAEAGVVPRVEHDIVESVFRLGDRQVGSIMIPRPDISWVRLTATPEDVRAVLMEQRREWILVCDGQVEEVRGVAHVADLLSTCLAGERFDLRAALAEPLYVPASTPAFRLLEMFRTTRQHVAVVLDEYGGVDGVVGLDDFLRELVGVMPAPSERDPTPTVTRESDGTWTADGAAAIEDVRGALDLPEVEVDARRGYRTLGGFLFSELGRVPLVGDVVRWREWHLLVEAMDGRRIARVRISRMTPERES